MFSNSNPLFGHNIQEVLYCLQNDYVVKNVQPPHHPHIFSRVFHKRVNLVYGKITTHLYIALSVEGA